MCDLIQKAAKQFNFFLVGTLKSTACSWFNAIFNGWVVSHCLVALKGYFLILAPPIYGIHPLSVKTYAAGSSVQFIHLYYIKAILRDLLMSAPSIYVLLTKFSTVYINR